MSAITGISAAGPQTPPAIVVSQPGNASANPVKAAGGQVNLPAVVVSLSSKATASAKATSTLPSLDLDKVDNALSWAAGANGFAQNAVHYDTPLMSLNSAKLSLIATKLRSLVQQQAAPPMCCPMRQASASRSKLPSAPRPSRTAPRPPPSASAPSASPARDRSMPSPRAKTAPSSAPRMARPGRHGSSPAHPAQRAQPAPRLPCRLSPRSTPRRRRPPSRPPASTSRPDRLPAAHASSYSTSGV